MELLSSCSRLHSNHLFCDCHLAWLSQWLRQRPTIGLFTQCSGPASLRGLNVAEVQKSEFSCSGGCHVLGLHLPSPPVLTAASFCPSLPCDEHLHPLTEIHSPPAPSHSLSALQLWSVWSSPLACLFLSALTTSLVCVFFLTSSPPLSPPSRPLFFLSVPCSPSLCSPGFHSMPSPVLYATHSLLSSLLPPSQCHVSLPWLHCSHISRCCPWLPMRGHQNSAPFWALCICSTEDCARR